MKHYVGLDVSMEETSICVVDEERRVVKEGNVESEPEAIAGFLERTGPRIERVGLGAGSLASALYHGLVDLGILMVCIDARHRNMSKKPARRSKPSDGNMRFSRFTLNAIHPVAGPMPRWMPPPGS